MAVIAKVSGLVMHGLYSRTQPMYAFLDVTILGIALALERS